MVLALVFGFVGTFFLFDVGFRLRSWFCVWFGLLLCFVFLVFSLRLSCFLVHGFALCCLVLFRVCVAALFVLASAPYVVLHSIYSGIYSKRPRKRHLSLPYAVPAETAPTKRSL